MVRIQESIHECTLTIILYYILCTTRLEKGSEKSGNGHKAHCVALGTVGTDGRPRQGGVGCRLPGDGCLRLRRAGAWVRRVAGPGDFCRGRLRAGARVGRVATAGNASRRGFGARARVCGVAATRDFG